MRYISFLLLLTTLYFKGFSQLNYKEVDDLNTLCKKEDFEAAKAFLKNKGYGIYSDNENYDHGSYFVLAEIQAKIKLGEYNNQYSTGTDLDNIYDKIEISFDEYDDYKTLEITQNLDVNSLLYISNSRKFDPLYQWLYDDWDYIKYEGFLGDSIWEKTTGNKSISEASRQYFSTKKFKDYDDFTIVFRKNDPELGERKEYHLFYTYDDYSDQVLKVAGQSYLSISTAVMLETIMDKGKNIMHVDKNIFAFPLFKDGSSYLLKIKFGNIIKTYLLDSGASDMTLDDQTQQYLKTTNELKIENKLTNREYILADGSKVQYKRVQIPTFSINNIIVKNINAVLVENGKPLLLGKSFLDSFKSWKVDNKNNMLIVEVF